MTTSHPALLASQLTEQGNSLAARGQWDEAACRYREAIGVCPTLPAPYTNLGNIYAQENRLEEAASCHRTAVGLDPGFAPAQVNLGNVLVRQGRIEEAFACLTLAERLRPDDPEIPYNLAIAQRKLGRLEIAAACYRRAIERNPSFAAAYSNLGVVLAEQGKLEEAIRCHRIAVAMGPAVAAFHNNLGNALRERGELDQAIACHRQAIALQPDDPDLRGNLGNELQEMGRFDEAWEAYEAAAACAPGRGSPYLHLANTGRLTGDSPHVAQMRALAADMESLPVQDQIALHFALAQVLKDDEQPAQAFQHLLAGNRLAREGIVYDEAATLAALDDTRARFPRERLAVAGRSGAQAPRPIFIVGMPRSGSTLVEQILAGHPAVFGAGELATLPRLIGRFGEDGLAELGAAYLADLRARAPDAGCVTDKLPGNFRHLGVIQLALPQARVIHVRRDRFDTCMSCFARLFAGDIPYAYDLGELGRYYSAYERLMAHWRAALRPGVMIEIDYEALVADLAGQTRRMLDHCGLRWDEACLAFHRNQRPVRTASTVQVRQPLYTSAVGRWRSVKEDVLF
jgi:tetratricopeptide (TPR) repeat protein